MSGCYGIRNANGGGDIEEIPARRPNPSDIALPAGYKIEVVASNLTFPSAIAFDDSGTPYVVESGYSYGEEWTEPRLLRIEPDGRKVTVATGGKNGPWNGVTFHQGSFYISEGGVLEGGKILRVNPGGQITTMISGFARPANHTILTDRLYGTVTCILARAQPLTQA